MSEKERPEELGPEPEVEYSEAKLADMRSMLVEAARRSVVESAFCAGIPQEALQRYTLAEVVKRLCETAHCLNDLWDASGESCGWDVSAVLKDAQEINTNFTPQP